VRYRTDGLFMVDYSARPTEAFGLELSAVPRVMLQLDVWEAMSLNVMARGRKGA
jgi:hypothetical protein